jgi:hypothetical protein
MHEPVFQSVDNSMRAYITIDTELSIAMFQKHGKTALEQNFRASIDGESKSGAGGIGYQMDVLERHGLKGVFFVDPKPALVCGIGPISRIVKAIITRGHDVQLHLHTEWLQFSETAPVGRTGQNIGDFSLADQVTLLAFARDWLVEAGAPPPFASGLVILVQTIARSMRSLKLAFITIRASMPHSRPHPIESICQLP